MAERTSTRQTGFKVKWSISVNQVQVKSFKNESTNIYSKHFEQWNADIVQLLEHYIYKTARAVVTPEWELENVQASPQL